MAKPPGIPNELLKHEREKRDWTQGNVAEELGLLLDKTIDNRTVRRWELGEAIPAPNFRRELAKIFGKSTRELGFPSEGEISFWHVPYRRNAFFTGREDILQRLHDTFQAQQNSPVQRLSVALSGLGGMGKSEVALEYAYRCRSQSHYHTILWLNAASYQDLLADIDAVADLLGLPGKGTAKPTQLVSDLKDWLMELTHWLLIFDNVENWQVLEDFLPDEIKGQVLLTTRSESAGVFAFHNIPVEPLDNRFGAELLLHRAKILPLENALEQATLTDAADARLHVNNVGGLALALDQAGAYIEETGILLAAYLELYQQNRHKLLNQRGAVQSRSQHPESVVVTLGISTAKACEQHPLAADLLDFCAFLQPEDMPEEILLRAIDPKFDAFSFNDAVAALQKYSLIKHNAHKSMFSMHQLVQHVLHDTMDASDKRQWQSRVVQALSAAFTDGDFAAWGLCARLLPHVLGCAAWTEHEFPPTVEQAQLLHKAGNYLRERGEYVDAVPLLERVIVLYEQLLGTEHPQTAAALNTRGILYLQRGNYPEAERCLKQALSIREQRLGIQHLDVAESLHYLAALAVERENYSLAESLAVRALTIREQNLGVDHPLTAKTTNGLAAAYDAQKQPDWAEPLYRRALATWQQRYGNDHPETARTLNDLGILYLFQEKYAQAEPLLEQAVVVKERLLGANHPDTALSLRNLALLYQAQGRYEAAEQLLERALRIRKQRLGPRHPNTGATHYALAKLYRLQGKYSQAVTRYRSVLAIENQQLGRGHPETKEIREEYITFLRSIAPSANATT